MDFSLKSEGTKTLHNQYMQDSCRTTGLLFAYKGTNNYNCMFSWRNIYRQASSGNFDNYLDLTLNNAETY